ncbi:DUF4365 domain-containing protein [Shewanella kaireitica]|uniref:DUF4365 domain-containing protein n=1 Tax=Shewanella kaireitica TaxID=212021 RepID=UPI00200F4F18|nr:DUF4365 domain-containing protein [Shewanella kaireitica]MCL1092656.1 DUF4365 domain-containing protein [Shewanella kaireitica]
MDLPNQIKQHKAESDSYAILLYHLRDVGIFRNVTENDYGIDFEIEFVEDRRVVGNYIKAQVKASEKLVIRNSDSVPTISGIKQSTLNYWAQLSFKSHVVAYAVDLKTENIYISKPLFWDVISKIDRSNSTKTIEFLPHQNGLKSQVPVAKVFTKAYSVFPSLLDEIYNHKLGLKNLKRFASLYADVFHYDICSEVESQDDFATFLEVCKVLLVHENFDNSKFSDEEKKYRYSHQYWCNQSVNSGYDDEVVNFIARKPMEVLFPLYLDALQKYENRVFSGQYFWLHKDPTYLRLVYENIIPTARDHDGISDLGYDYPRERRNHGLTFNSYCAQI